MQAGALTNDQVKILDTAGTNEASVDAQGNQHVVLYDASGNALLNSAATRGYVRHTDGTNLTPAMDAVTRAGYQYITDGTNTQPTLDANTRRGYVQLTDGTNEPDIEQAADDSSDMEDKYGIVTNAILNGRISNTAIRPLRVDSSTHSIQIVDYDHHEIHSGSSFHVGYSVVTANSDDDVTGIMFTTPDTTTWVHIVATFACSDPAEAIILENPTLADAGDGTDKVVLNRNRNSATTSTVQSLEDTPTVGSVTTMNEAEWTAVGVSGGTELEHEYLQGGSGPKAVGGVSRGTQEWMLDQNTTYVFYLQNTGASANTHSISLDWYEHADKN